MDDDQIQRMWYASTEAGAYLESIGVIPDMTLEQWEQFLRILICRYEDPK